MLIVKKLVKLVVITAIFFTIFDLIAYGEINWYLRLLS